MKRLGLFIIISLLIAPNLIGQNASMWPDSITYVTPEDEVHMRDKAAKYLVKIGSDIGFEFKLSKAFSLELEFSPENTRGYGLDLGIGIGSRFYFQMAERIKAGKQANNFSGSYVSLLYGRGMEFGTNNFSLVENSNAITLGIGTQQRYLQWEYFDFGVFMDFREVSFVGRPKKINSFTLRTESNYGVVIGKRHKVNKENVCPVIKCHQDRRSAIKLNRNNLFAFSISDIVSSASDIYLRVQPNIGYEFKLGNSPFSIDQNLNAEFIFSNYDHIFPGIYRGQAINFKLQKTLIRYNAALRYYFNMKRKVLTGEQGNNLSGGYLYTKYEHRQSYFSIGQNGNSGKALFGIGRQTSITGKLFFDMKIAVGPRLYGDFNYTGELLNLDDFAGELDFSIGYMF